MPKENVKIGLEIHVPLKTKEKLYCSCPTNYYEISEPNLNICEVCTGMPGAKPYPINEEALKSAIIIAKLLNCKIVNENIFVKRKHYNYPDLPSGYQRTSEPIGIDGNLNGISIWEVHLEEDPGRYDLTTGRVDYNRSGVPLVEIVTAPEMRSAEEARNFLKELLNLLEYSERIIEVGGLMRVDINISIEDSARVEIKNVNSIKGAFKAIHYEILRQKNLKKIGKRITQETRGFNEKQMITIKLREKETAEDYRYIPDPDIPPLFIAKDYEEKIPLPETPKFRKEKIIEKYKIPERYASILVKEKEVADLFEEVANKVNPEFAAKWICGEVFRQLNYRSIQLFESKLNSKIMIELLELLQEKKITENTGKKILERVIDTGESPKIIVEEERHGKITNEEEISKILDDVLRENEKAVKDYISGKEEALHFLIGKVMQKMRGRADNKIVRKLLNEKLNSERH